MEDTEIISRTFPTLLDTFLAKKQNSEILPSCILHEV